MQKKIIIGFAILFFAGSSYAQMPETVVASPQTPTAQAAPPAPQGETVAQPAQTVTAPPIAAPVAPTQTFFYYCDKAKAYYPNVQQCADGWIAVPAGSAVQVTPYAPVARPWPARHYWADANGDEVIHSRRNAVSFEFFGRALLYSLNYDYLIGDRFGLGLGISSWQSNSWWSNVDSTVTVVPVYGNYYFSNHIGRGFVSAGADFVSVTNPNLGQTNNVFNDNGVVAVVGGGYEMREPSGYLLRFGGFLLAGKSTTTVSPSVSVGYAF